MSQLRQFGIDFALSGGAALLLATPALVIALKRGLRSTVRRFLLASAGVGVATGLLSLVSRWLVDRCREAGNTGCVDYGAAGMQLLVLVAFGIVSLTRAFVMARS